MEWLLIDKRIPQTRQKVLFVAPSYGLQEAEKGTFVAHYENEHGYHGSVFVASNGGLYKAHHVTAWMPLPEFNL